MEQTDQLKRMNPLLLPLRVRRVDGLLSRLSAWDAGVVLAAFAIYLAHASMLGDWIMDDAGISFVYARNLAAGYGLVSQPGRAPVEGFSNPLWVLLMVPFFWAGVFDPIWTPKVLSAGLVLVTLGYLYDASRRILGSRFLSGVLCALLVTNTPFAVWTISGMENPLYALLAVLMFWFLVRSPARLPEIMGVLTGLAALTRPEGVLYVLVCPLYLAVKLHLQERGDRPDLRNTARCLARFLWPFLLLAGGYEVFRILYFGDIVPNTYHAKASGSLRREALVRLLLLEGYPWDKTIEFWQIFLGRLALVSLLGVVASLAFAWGARAWDGMKWSVVLLLLPVWLGFVLLPRDWMGEYRFATNAVPFIYLLLLMVGQLWAEGLPLRGGWRYVALLLIALVFLGASVRRHFVRTQRFAANPPTPFKVIVEKYGRRFDEYAALLGLERASVLLPDMGGTLYSSSLTVYDLGALTDRTIALTMRKNQSAFYDYVFDEIRPTFIVTYSGWAQFADLDGDPRFRRDYVPIRESIDELLLQSGIEMYSGVYVRKDALPDETALARLRGQ